MLVVCVCYVAFALRRYYIRPTIVFRDFVPIKEQKVIQEWYNSNDSYQCPELNFDGMVDCLSNPYKYKPIAIVTHKRSLVQDMNNRKGLKKVYLRDVYELTINGHFSRDFEYLDGEFVSANSNYY
jgi:hypothetical protein